MKKLFTSYSPGLFTGEIMSIPFPQTPYPLFAGEYLDVNKRFFALETERDGAAYLQDLRSLTPLYMRKNRKNWTRLNFNGRPAIYHIIALQKLPLLESLLTCKEGRVWVHHRYKERSSRLSTGHEARSEYPIHTAVRMACYAKSTPQKIIGEQIVLKLLEFGADPKQEDFLGRTPIYIALVANALSLVKLLIQCEGFAVKLDCPSAPLQQWHFNILNAQHHIMVKENRNVLLNYTAFPKVVVILIMNYLFNRD